MTTITEVAAAVIERPDGAFLLACRPEGKPYPGYWEFPGGKIEPGEDARAALSRELKEELGIAVREATPWITRVYAYTHATVRLRFFRVTTWDGEPQPLEDQAIAWQWPGKADVAPMLPANAPVLAALALPSVMVVSNAIETGFDAWALKLSAQVIEEKLLVQIREKGLEHQRVQHLLSRALTRGTPFGAIVVVNSDCGTFPQADGVHLTSRALMAATARPAGRVVGASCHDASEIAQAAKLGLDYVVVGPVMPTASHPGAVLLGWEGFAALVSDCPLPAYAIGGLARADLAAAKRHGAHGVALRSAAFNA
ncbi:MAG TPA: Nudix family hydrolase [Usitatibacteraceae bacterium]|nr:Nudix family hydrolase [Usitatibacteraceae bacterium]